MTSGLGQKAQSTGSFDFARFSGFIHFWLRRDTRDRARHGCVTRARRMESIARIVCVDGWGLARAPRVRRPASSPASRPASRRAASVPPPGATRRGWGDTDSRFSRLDRRGEERGDDRGDRGDADRNISFQELRKRQDREQRKVCRLFLEGENREMGPVSTTLCILTARLHLESQWTFLLTFTSLRLPRHLTKTFTVRASLRK